MSDGALAPAWPDRTWTAAARWRSRAVAALGLAAARLGLALGRQASRAFLWLVVAFAAGIVAFFAWDVDPPLLLGPVTTCLGLAGAILTRGRRGLFALTVTLAAMGAGHTAADLRSRIVATPVLTRTLASREVHGRVAGAEARPGSYRIVLENLQVPDLDPAATPVRVRLSIPEKNGLPKVGEHIAVRAVLRPPMHPALPGAFQFARTLYFAQIGATGTTFGMWRVEQARPDATRDRLSASLEAIRRTIAVRVMAAVPDHADATTTAALIMGEQSAIPNDLQESYRKSGLAHLLSISGVHMSLLAAAVFFVIRRGLALFPAIALRADTKKIAAWGGLFATTLYVLISGLSVPAIRSFLMIGVVLFAVLIDRTAISLRTIGWAALVLMTLYPEAVIGASFQMSFMAVLALIALAEHVRLHVRWRGPDGRLEPFRAAGLILLGLALTDIAASGSTALFAIYHFNRFPTYSMVSNFFAGPITGFWVMPWGLVAMLLMPFGLDRIPLYLMGQGVGLVNTIARIVGDWPGAQVHVPPMSPYALAIGVAGLLVVCLWQGRLRFVGLALFAVAVAEPWIAAAPDLIIDETAKVIAVSDPHGRLVMAPGRGDKFIRSVWLDRYGVATETWGADGNAALGLRCDAAGCMLSRHGRTILIGFTSSALAEDCRTVDAAVSSVPGRAFCGHTPLADLFDLRRRGAAALSAGPDGVSFRYALDEAGDRRWSPHPPPIRRGPRPPVNNDAADRPDDPEP